MKKALALLVLVVLLLINNDSHAKIFRIGYPGISVPGIDYAYDNIPAAITAASAGDTLQLYQHYWTSSVNTGTINKRLIFIGYGYLLDKNSGLQTISNSSLTCDFYFDSGSEGSVVQGGTGNFYFAASNIAVLRSAGTFTFGYSPWSGHKSGTSNVTLMGNYILNATTYNGVTNMYLSNCIVENGINLAAHSGFFVNNTVYNTSSFGSFVIKNNIFFGGNCTAVNSNLFSDNLFSFSNSCSIGGPGNQFNVEMANVFQNWNSSAPNGQLFVSGPNNERTDNKLSLKLGGTGIGIGKNGDGTATDVGIFGGETGQAYKLSGIPPVPAIYKLSAPSQTANSNPYTITISIRGNN